MKKIVSLVVIVLAVLIVLSVAKNMIAKTAISAGVKAMTGLKLSIKSMNVGVFRTLIGIKGLALHNPSGFPDKLMADLPEIYVDYDLGAFLQKKVHLEEVRLSLKELIIVKNDQGELNINSLKVVKAQKEGQAAKKKAKGEAPKIQIDNLELKVGRVLYKDYSQGTPPTIREFNVNINERYANITDPASLVSLILVRAMMNTAIANLADFNLQGLQNIASDTLSSAEKVVSKTATKAKEAIKQTSENTKVAVEKTTEKTKEAVKETTEALQKATEGLKDMIKSPF